MDGKTSLTHIVIRKPALKISRFFANFSFVPKNFPSKTPVTTLSISSNIITIFLDVGFFFENINTARRCISVKRFKVIITVNLYKFKPKLLTIFFYFRRFVQFHFFKEMMLFSLICKVDVFNDMLIHNPLLYIKINMSFGLHFMRYKRILYPGFI